MNLLKHRKILFYFYSCLNSVFNAVLNVSPPIFRDLVLKLSLKAFGRGSFIDYGSYIRYPRKIAIGKNVEINRGVQFFPSLLFTKAMIVIEDNVVIGPNVHFYSAGQIWSDGSFKDIGDSIHIRAGAYIGADCVIRYGVEVGTKAIVGAGSVVVKNVDAHTVVAGNPAAILRY